MKQFRTVLIGLAAAMALVVVARMLVGPFQFIMPVHVPLNPEGVFGLAIVSLFLTAAVASATNDAPPQGRMLLWGTGVAILAVAGFGRVVHIGFLSDDFSEVRLANLWSFGSLFHDFTTAGGDQFLRPLGHAALGIESVWARFNPIIWHALTLALHIANALLVMMLARRMGASAMGGGIAGALFAIHGTRPEVAVWIAGHFDLFATFLFLCGMLLFTSSRTIPALACFLLAAFCKESAYVFPLLVLIYALWKKQSWRVSIPYFAAGAAAFFYRLIVVGGIGGYSAEGHSLFFSLGLGSTLKVLLARLWMALFFPLNWSTEPARWLGIAAAVYAVSLIWTAMRTKPAVPLWPATASLLAAILPPLHLLSGAPDLSGSRFLYLPSVWFCILLALAVEGLPATTRWAVATVLVAFHFAALEHNLTEWEYASERVAAACAVGVEAAGSSTRFVALDLPESIQGVPAFRNSFGDCLEIGVRHPVDVKVIGSSHVLELREDTTYLMWDPAVEQLKTFRLPPR